MIDTNLSGSLIWCTPSELSNLNKIGNRLRYHLLWGCPDKTKERSERNKDNRKLAYICQGKTKFTAWVDNVTGKAYRNDGSKYYSPTWNEIKVFTFVKWLNSFDV